ncbi:MAG: HAD family phosphatase [Patescibacteria group bacterium]
MNKAFIFDFDGVIINNEPAWEQAKEELYQRLFGKEVYLCLGSTLGINMDDIYKRAQKCGTRVSKKTFLKEFQSYAPKIYQSAPLAEGVDAIGQTLTDLGYKIAIVSASPMEWISIALKRTKLKKYLTYALSLYDRIDLPHKPAPDGYLEAIKILKASPKATCVLEDSNPGIESAKAAGVFAIGFQQNSIGHELKNADAYAKNLDEVVQILKKDISK